jgi:hypothetical protein
VEAEGSLESPKESPPPNPREINLNCNWWENNRNRSARSGSYASRHHRPTNLEPQGDGKTFEIKTSTICVVQHSPFIGKEDPNLHLQAFIQLVTQNQMRARLFLFSLLRKALL